MSGFHLDEEPTFPLPKAAKYALAACLLLVVVATTLAGWALTDRFDQGNRNRAAQTEAIRTILCYARASIPDTDPAFRDQADQFYDHALSLIHARPCATVLKGTS